MAIGLVAWFWAQVAAPPQRYEDSVVAVVAFAADDTVVSMASGFVVSDEGLVVSSYRAVRQGERIEAVEPDGARWPVEEIVQVDAARDIAILRVGRMGFRPLPLGGPTTPAKGSSLFSVSGVVGFEPNLSEGVVLGHLDVDGQMLLRTSFGPCPGAEGAPVLDELGRVVGVSIGPGFAVPVRYVRELLDGMRN